MFVSPKEAQTFYGVTKETLRQWSLRGEIDYKLSKGGHRKYKIISGITRDISRKSYIYARVSSRKQTNDLKNQISILHEKYPTHEIISDIGSGINEKRKGYKTLLDKIISGNVKEIVVAHKDRLSRFSFELFKSICTKFGTKIIIACEEVPKDGSEELTEDLMSIIAVFTARYYGKRKY